MYVFVLLQFSTDVIQWRNAQSQLRWPPLPDHPAGQRPRHSRLHVSGHRFLHCPQHRAGERWGHRWCHRSVSVVSRQSLSFPENLIYKEKSIHNLPPSLLSLVFEVFDDPTALVVLLEEELVVIDLQTPGWPSLPSPYLAPLHSSAITCSCHISHVPPKLWERLINAGKVQQGCQRGNKVSSVIFIYLFIYFKLNCGSLLNNDKPQFSSVDLGTLQFFCLLNFFFTRIKRFVIKSIHYSLSVYSYCWNSCNLVASW